MKLCVCGCGQVVHVPRGLIAGHKVERVPADHDCAEGCGHERTGEPVGEESQGPAADRG